MKSSLLFILLIGAYCTLPFNIHGQSLEHADHTKSMTETFIVYGNCGMCEKRIEKSIQEVAGVFQGDWNNETGEMTVAYDPSKITLNDIKQKIADAGHDTETIRANNSVYSNLPGCCQYDRPN